MFSCYKHLKMTPMCQTVDSRLSSTQMAWKTEVEVITRHA